MRFTVGPAGADLQADRRHLPGLCQRVIPVANDRRLTVERGDFAAAGGPRLDDLLRARPRREARAGRPAAGADRWSIRTAAPPTEEIEVDYDADPPRYRLPTPATSSTSPPSLDGDTALLKFADPGSPTLVQDREGAAALYVLMPMRV